VKKRNTDNRRYYISTGRLNGFYTLRVTFSEPTYYKSEYGVVDSGIIARDHYVMTLTRDPQTAMEKAMAYLGEKIDPPDFDLDEIRRGRDIDWMIFQGGKHVGKTIDWVLKNDLEYTLWAAENLSGTRYDKTVEILQEVLAPILKERAAARETVAKSAKDQQAERAAMLAEFAERMKDDRGGFRDSIARDLQRGFAPTGRGLSIALDILAKQMGRGGSKAYDAEYDRIGEIFDRTNEP